MHLGINKITYNRTATHFMDDSFMNLGEDVILTLLWQSGASESATVSFVISLSICYWLFKRRVLRVMCVCARMCERERERVTAQRRVTVCVPACVREREKGGHSAALCVCVCERERERERGSQRSIVWLCVCPRVWERRRHGHTTAAYVQTHTSFITESVTWLCSPLGLELMVKLRTLFII